jgi:hypothetical protein
MPDAGGDLKFILSVDTAQGLMSLKQFDAQLNTIGDSGSRAGARVVSGLNNMHAGAQQATEQVSGIQQSLDRIDGGKAAKSLEALPQHFENAHITAQSLERQIGFELPRAVGTFLAESSVIGPVLSAAFSTVAIIGFAQALAQIPEIYDRMQGAVTGWGAASRKAYADLLVDNMHSADEFVSRPQLLD